MGESQQNSFQHLQVKAILAFNRIEKALSTISWLIYQHLIEVPLSLGLTHPRFRICVEESGVAPIPEINNDYVLVSIDKKININKLDDIINLTVGVQRGTPAQEMLKKAGFISIEPVNFEEQNVEKLRKGRIKLWAIPRLVGKYVYKTRGYDPDELNFGYVLSRPVIYFAASKSISVSDMNKWKEALDTMRADGTFEKIISKSNINAILLRAYENRVVNACLVDSMS